MDHGPSDRPAVDQPSVPFDRLVEADSACEIAAIVDTTVAELPPVSEARVWLFESSESRLTQADTEDDAPKSPSSLAKRAFETGEPQESDDPEVSGEPSGSDEPIDDPVDIAYPLGAAGVVALATDDLTPEIRSAVDDLSTVAGACLEHRREYTQLEGRFHRVAERNRRLSQFARTVSHDLNSPLSVIYGRIELALAEPEEAEIHLQAARNAAQRVDSLITDHLQTIETADANTDTEAVSVQTVATEAWRIIDPSMARLQIEPQLDRVEANAIRLQQLFENLIRNAIEHGSEEAVGLASTVGNRPTPSVFDDDTNTVTVTIKPTPTGFAVCDNGPGIPPEEREAIFESGYTTTESGSGLGLHIVTEIVDAHGWEITVGESADGGARFDVHVE
ncbi:MAG: sensor histidine kinase [Halohasta sp.]